MVIYADVLFGVNLAMDYLILWAVGKLARKKAKSSLKSSAGKRTASCAWRTGSRSSA